MHARHLGMFALNLGNFGWKQRIQDYIFTNLQNLSTCENVFILTYHFKAITLGIHQNRYKLIDYGYNFQYFKMIWSEISHTFSRISQIQNYRTWEYFVIFHDLTLSCTASCLLSSFVVTWFYWYYDQKLCKMCFLKVCWDNSSFNYLQSL